MKFPVADAVGTQCSGVSALLWGITLHLQAPPCMPCTAYACSWALLASPSCAVCFYAMALPSDGCEA